jgi:hypothetical protein
MGLAGFSETTTLGAPAAIQSRERPITPSSLIAPRPESPALMTTKLGACLRLRDLERDERPEEARHSFKRKSGQHELGVGCSRAWRG